MLLDNTKKSSNGNSFNDKYEADKVEVKDNGVKNGENGQMDLLLEAIESEKLLLLEVIESEKLIADTVNKCFGTNASDGNYSVEHISMSGSSVDSISLDVNALDA